MVSRASTSDSTDAPGVGIEDRGAVVRPVGLVEPGDATSRRILVALRDGRVEDAERQLQLMRSEATCAGAPVEWVAPVGSPTKPPKVDRVVSEAGLSGRQVWVWIVTGLVREARGDLSEATRAFEDAARLRNPVSMRTPVRESERDPLRCASERASGSAIEVQESDAWRVRALALECLGRMLRRMDDPIRAKEAHRESLDTRETFGSWEECWRSAHELAQDAWVSGDAEDAIRWHRKAEAHAASLGEEGAQLRAESLRDLARVLHEKGDAGGAIAAAAASMEIKNRLEPSGLGTFRTALELARYRVAQFARALDVTPIEVPRTEGHGSAESLDSVMRDVAALREEFRAWAWDGSDDVSQCEDILDFAGRLRAAVEA